METPRGGRQPARVGWTMTVSDAQLHAWIVEALADIREPGQTLEEVLEDREPKSMDAARAFGFLEGAAAALNATVLELRWSLRIETEARAAR